MSDCYFLLWCDEDTSYSLVNAGSVVYNESVGVGDQVKFFVRTREYLGEVKGMGEDYDKLKQLQDELNATNKPKQPSFHADRKRQVQPPDRFSESVMSSKSSSSRPVPRKPKSQDKVKKLESAVSPVKRSSPKKSYSMSMAKIAAARAPAAQRDAALQGARGLQKALERMAAEKMAADKKAADKKAAEGKSTEKKDTPQQATQKSLPLTQGDSDLLSSSSSEEDLTPEEKAIYIKIKAKQARKHAKIDARALRNLELSQEFVKRASSQCVLKSDKTDMPANPSSNREQCSEVFENEYVSIANDDEVTGNDSNHAAFGTGVIDNGDSDSSSEESHRKPPTPKKNHSADKTLTYEGNQFLYLDPGVDQSEFEELKGPKGKLTGIFCLKANVSKARRLGKTASSYARKVMEGVFNDEALMKCTVSGDLYKAGGKEKQIRKPKLDEKAVEAVIDAALVRQEKKKWSPTCDPLTVKNSLRQKLVDKRLARKTAAVKKVQAPEEAEVQ